MDLKQKLDNRRAAEQPVEHRPRTQHGLENATRNSLANHEQDKIDERNLSDYLRHEKKMPDRDTDMAAWAVGHAKRMEAQQAKFAAESYDPSREKQLRKDMGMSMRI